MYGIYLLKLQINVKKNIFFRENHIVFFRFFASWNFKFF